MKFRGLARSRPAWVLGTAIASITGGFERDGSLARAPRGGRVGLDARDATSDPTGESPEVAITETVADALDAITSSLLHPERTVLRMHRRILPGSDPKGADPATTASGSAALATAD